jgi:hypothetical protein
MTDVRPGAGRQNQRPLTSTIRLASLALALLISLLACALGAPGGTPIPPQSVATVVSATLTAIGPGITSAPSLTPEAAQETASVVTAVPAHAGPSVAFVQGGQVWLASPGAAARQLTASGRVEQLRISDDGRLIVYTYRPSPDNPAQLRAIAADGTGETVLLSAAQLDALEPPAGFVDHNEPSQMSFIPGSHVLLLNLRGVAQGPGQPKYDDLWRLDADGGSITPIYPAGQGGDAVISPDGTSMTLSRPESISLSAIDGSRLQSDLIRLPMINTYSEYNYRPAAAWNPSSQAAGAVIPSPDPLATSPSAEVWMIPNNGSPASRLATVQGQFLFFGQGSQPLLSPDLSRLAFIRQTATPNQSELLTANADGSGETGYGSGSFRWLGWSPDSQHFAYIDTLASGPVIMMASVGGTPAPLAAGQALTWISATGFISLQGSPANWSLILGDLQGSSDLLAGGGGGYPAFDVAP